MRGFIFGRTCVFLSLFIFVLMRLRNKNLSYRWDGAHHKVLTIEYVSRNKWSHMACDRYNWLRTCCIFETQRTKPFIVSHMTLKVDQGHWQWHDSIGDIHFLLRVYSNHVSISYRFWDIKHRIMSPARPRPMLSVYDNWSRALGV